MVVLNLNIITNIQLISVVGCSILYNILYTVYCIVYTVYCVMCTLSIVYTLYSVHRLYTVYCIV